MTAGDRLVVVIDKRTLSPPTALPGESVAEYNARCLACRPPRPECRKNADGSRPYRDPDPVDPAELEE